LVHGDLSEYNILVAPASHVQNHSTSIENASLDLQTVLIDFGQAVDISHPESESLLLRDIGIIRKFFLSRGVKDVMSVHDSLTMVMADVEEADDDDGSPDEQVEGEPTPTTKTTYIRTFSGE